MSMNAVPSGSQEPDNKRALGAGGGGPPYNGGMDRRLTVLETRFDTILPTLATKADLADLRLDMAKLSTEVHRTLMRAMMWFGAVAITILGSGAGVFVHFSSQVNNQIASLSARLPVVGAPPVWTPDRQAPALVPPAQR